ncbi:hypothetical protein PAMA_001483 [Pampus argenteus]
MDQKAVCAGCHRLIRDRFLLRVTDGLWHEACVRCAACGDELTNSCFLRDRKLYCKRDYAKETQWMRELILVDSALHEPWRYVMWHLESSAHSSPCVEQWDNAQPTQRIQVNPIQKQDLSLCMSTRPAVCLPDCQRSTASDTAAGATATVSEAKLTGLGCQALRCTPCHAKGMCLSGRGRRRRRGEKSGLFAVRCGSCAEAISPAELVMRAGAAVFHLRCFTCSVCSCRLQTGDRCVLREGQLLCAREDYHQCLASPTSSDTGKSDDDEEEEEESGRVTGRRIRSEDPESKRPKRPRTILTTQQRRTFKASFEMKKLARRQQQQQQQEQQQTQEQCEHPSHHTAPSCGGLTSELERLGSSYSHIQQQQMGLTTLEQQDYDMDPFRQGLTPPQMPGDHMHPYDYKGLYGDMDQDPLCHVADSDYLSLGDSSLLTPIDRLYSMQDSYFTS